MTLNEYGLLKKKECSTYVTTKGEPKHIVYYGVEITTAKSFKKVENIISLLNYSILMTNSVCFVEPLYSFQDENRFSCLLHNVKYNFDAVVMLL